MVFPIGTPNTSKYSGNISAADYFADPCMYTLFSQNSYADCNPLYRLFVLNLTQSVIITHHQFDL